MVVIETSSTAAISLLIEANPVVILNIGAESWCAPCRALRPHFDAAAEKVDAVFIRADLDENSVLGSIYGVMSVPTVLAFVNGENVGPIHGRTVQKIIKEVEALTAS